MKKVKGANKAEVKKANPKASKATKYCFKNLCKSIAFRRAIIIFNLIIVIAFLSAWHIFRESRYILRNQLFEYFTTVAGVTAEFTNGDIHKSILLPKDMNSPNYKEVKSTFNRILSNAQDVKYIYTIVQKQNKLYFIVDSQKDENAAKVMDLYDISIPEIAQAFYTAKPVVRKEPYTDKWGTFISAYAPIKDKDGNVVAIVGVDMEVSKYIEMMNNVTKPFYLGLIIASLFGILFATLTYKDSKRKINV